MKLLWLAHEGGVSGANKCLLEYMEILRGKGYTQFLVVPSRGDLALKAGGLQVAVTCIPYYSWTSGKGEPAPGLLTRLRKRLRNRIALKKIKKLIRQTGAERVITNSIAISVGAYAAAKTGRRHFWFVHEFGEADHGFTIAGNFERGARIMNRLSEKIVFNGRAVEEPYLPFVPAEKRAIVAYSINMPFFPSVPTDSPARAGKLKLILLGQIAPSKDPLEAVKALALCRDRGLSFELNIVGRPDQPAYLQELEQAIAQAGLGQQIHLQGSSEEPALPLRQNHALLMCSRMEAFGRVTVEALKMGLPVIAADTGGSLDLIRDGENGWLYHKGDPLSLADRILQLNRDYDRFDRTRIAAEAEKSFNAVQTAEQLEKIFS